MVIQGSNNPLVIKFNTNVERLDGTGGIPVG